MVVRLAMCFHGWHRAYHDGKTGIVPNTHLLETTVKEADVDYIALEKDELRSSNCLVLVM